MKVKLAIVSLTFVTVFVASFLLYTPSACACGEVYEGTAAFHWDEMSTLERARYYITGYVPFDAKGERI